MEAEQSLVKMHLSSNAEVNADKQVVDWFYLMDRRLEAVEKKLFALFKYV